ncbi:hypothetical protein ALMP_66290 [Streptomyces sp. A012304]|nr:hypothetical protein ALMP_66290 [Streptomyces sp. A012304]
MVRDVAAHSRNCPRAMARTPPGAGSVRAQGGADHHDAGSGARRAAPLRSVVNGSAPGAFVSAPQSSLRLRRSPRRLSRRHGGSAVGAAAQWASHRVGSGARRFDPALLGAARRGVTAVNARENGTPLERTPDRVRG